MTISSFLRTIFAALGWTTIAVVTYSLVQGLREPAAPMVASRESRFASPRAGESSAKVRELGQKLESLNAALGVLEQCDSGESGGESIPPIPELTGLQQLAKDGPSGAKYAALNLRNRVGLELDSRIRTCMQDGHEGVPQPRGVISLDVSIQTVGAHEVLITGLSPPTVVGGAVLPPDLDCIHSALEAIKNSTVRDQGVSALPGNFVSKERYTFPVAKNMKTI